MYQYLINECLSGYLHSRPAKQDYDMRASFLNLTIEGSPIYLRYNSAESTCEILVHEDKDK